MPSAAESESWDVDSTHYSEVFLRKEQYRYRHLQMNARSHSLCQAGVSQDWTELGRRCSQLAERSSEMSPQLLQTLMHEKSKSSPAAPPPEAPSLNPQPVPATVSLPALERARSTLEDFFRCYLPFHGMKATCIEDVFRHLPLLVFVEAFIYELDEANEEVLLPSGTYRTHTERKSTDSDPWAPLKYELAARGLLTPRINAELDSGVRYWERERLVCGDGEEVSWEDAMEGLGWKSFDYRLLNLLLYSLRGAAPQEEHLRFLRLSEILVEISDDLFDYEEDVLRNSFNILRLSCKVYGPEGGPRHLARYISDVEQQYAEELKELDVSLAIKFTEQCKEASRIGGGSGSSSPLGSWTIPPIIIDEASYRQRHSSSP